MKRQKRKSEEINPAGRAEIKGLGAKAETTFSETTLYAFEDTSAASGFKKK
ncbi:MAG: hypothetical protein JW747_08360 [Candidatus Aminicenantes bacterium]|nr:hypothetical protein [Candidatus Aminicenantes bacterium]